MQLWGASARHEGAGAAREEVGNDTSVTSTLFRARHHTQASQCESVRKQALQGRSHGAYPCCWRSPGQRRGSG